MRNVAKIIFVGLVCFGAAFGGMWAARRFAAGPPAADIGSVLQGGGLTPARFEETAAPADFRTPVAKISPAVVSVDRFDQITDFFGESRGEQQTGTGSGVIISADGYILTNHHVVANADRVQIRMSDERTSSAKVVGTDARSDLAVLKIEEKNLTPAVLGDSAKLEVGVWVIAIGNPLGYSNTVSVGVVSNLNRSLQTSRETMLVDGIQTDAAINQGNSGGALANIRGELVGINSAIATNSGGSIGLGFAIPINRAKRVVEDILKFGRVRYGTLGVTIVDRPGLLQLAYARQQIERFAGSAPPKDGIVVRSVAPGSPGEKMGLQEVDILMKVDAMELKLPIDLTKALIDKRPGDKVRLTYWSKGQTKTVEVVLSEPLPEF